MQRTYVYIDGFNLYYRLLKKAPQYRWLDIAKLSRAVLREENIVERVNFYTAAVSAKIDPDAPAKQRIYLNALETLPEVAIHRGNFLVNDKWVRAKAPEGVPEYVKASVSEEKGSDVNLASHLIRDAFQNRFDVAAVITNDTDLVEPIRIVAQEIGLPVGILSPVENPAKSLKQVASFLRHIRPGHLSAAQFPDQIEGTEIVRPESWTAR
jgi:uncharacterized LabA/DUF88 family protein